MKPKKERIIGFEHILRMAENRLGRHDQIANHENRAVQENTTHNGKTIELHSNRPGDLTSEVEGKEVVYRHCLPLGSTSIMK
jgi:hypothetical protein